MDKIQMTMKKFLTLSITMFLLACIVTGCATKRIEYRERTVIKVDSVVTHDTVPVPVEVTKYQTDSSKLNLLQNKNDSLLNALDSKQAQLDYLAKQLKAGKLNSDTLKMHTDLANAWAAIVNNELKGGIEQLPFDTILNIINTNTSVNHSQVTDKSETKYIAQEVAPAFYKDGWFYAFAVLVLICIVLLVKRFIHRQ